MSCCLCSQIAGEREGDLIYKLLGTANYRRYIAMEGAHFVVIPSLGPLVRGHSLLCPREHCVSLAQMAEEAHAEFYSMKAALVGMLQRLYKAPIHMFEHGDAPGSSRTICSVGHAHLHFVPCHADIDGHFHIPTWQEVDASLTQLRALASNSEYIYYETPDGRAFISLARDTQFESQYMRRLFADALGNARGWNWRDEPNVQGTMATYTDLLSVLQAC